MSRRVCGRSLEAGPGSCHSWWESCPATTRHCFMRFVRENGGTIDRAKAEEWDRARLADVEPEPTML
jgi:hypothetical protein